MGIVADAALAAGAKVIGVIPTALHGREVGHVGLTDLVVVPTCRSASEQMFALSDAVAVLPGGLGTLDEAFEAITLRQLSFFDKPIVLSISTAIGNRCSRWWSRSSRPALPRRMPNSFTGGASRRRRDSGLFQRLAPQGVTPRRLVRPYAVLVLRSVDTLSSAD